MTRLTLEIGHFQVALDINAENVEMFFIVVLHLGLVEHRGFHAVTERAVLLLEENQHPLLAGLPREAEFFLEVAEGFVEEVFPRVTRRCGTRERARQYDESKQNTT